MRTVTEPFRRIPVTREADVIVVGGGPAGFSATIASARGGAKTLLVERFGFLGGTATAMSVQGKVAPRGLDIAGLQRELVTQNAELRRKI